MQFDQLISLFFYLKKGENDELYNDIYSIEFFFNDETGIYSKAIWKQLETIGKKPLERNSHTCNLYRDEYLIIIGGEGNIEKGIFLTNCLFKKTN